MTITNYRAKKVGGSYQAEGTIVSTFATLAGETRHVFEFDQPAGMLHIFGPGQVEIAAAPQVVADERTTYDISTPMHIHIINLDSMLLNYRCAATPEKATEFKSAILKAVSDIAAPVQAQEPVAVPDCVTPTYLTEDQGREWAWKDVKKDVGTKGWTAGDNGNYFGFFVHGWNYRGQFEKQRAAAPAAQGDAIRKVEVEDQGSLGVVTKTTYALANAKDAKDAERWREALQYVGADRSPALGCDYFVLRGIHVTPGSNLMRGSVAGHFTAAIDAAIAAKAAS